MWIRCQDGNLINLTQAHRLLVERNPGSDTCRLIARLGGYHYETICTGNLGEVEATRDGIATHKGVQDYEAFQALHLEATREK